MPKMALKSITEKRLVIVCTLTNQHTYLLIRYTFNVIYT